MKEYLFLDSFSDTGLRYIVLRPQDFFFFDRDKASEITRQPFGTTRIQGQFQEQKRLAIKEKI
jgi:hypothetical protein